VAVAVAVAAPPAGDRKDGGSWRVISLIQTGISKP
jgi:hypothetical protein